MIKKSIFITVALLFAINSFELIAQNTQISITKEGNYTISASDGAINLKAIDFILLKPNTWIKSGSNFHAQLLDGSSEYLAPDLSDENYTFTQKLQIPVTNINQISKPEDVLESVSYFDEFGRPIQEIALGQAANNRDLITHIPYDAKGRKNKEYLPFVSQNLGEKGTFRSVDLDQKTKNYYASNYAADFTSSIKNPYSEKKYDFSPLSKTLKEGYPGADWEVNGAHVTQYDYKVNTATEVRKYTISLNSNRIPTLNLSSGSSGYYNAGELYKTITYDEDHVSGSDGVMEKFEDQEERTVLERTYLNGQKYDTYYVYDAFGNLTYVLPPKAEAHSAKPNSTLLDEVCYKYVYDQRNRVVEKKLPGKAEEFLVYDLLDRPILTQKGIQRIQTPLKEWSFLKYDDRGRVIYSGLFKTNDTRQAIQQIVDAKAGDNTKNYETKVSSGTGFEGTYYTNNDYPSSNLEVLNVNYYDDYTFNRAGAPITINSYGVSNISDPHNLLTGTRMKVLETSDWITTVNYYTTKGRLIYSYSKNEHLQTTDLTSSQLDFIGRITKTKMTHKKTGHSDLVTEDEFTYDHTGRLLQQTQIINNQTSQKEILIDNTYTNLGELTSKGVGGRGNQNRLQTIDYKHNVRGWVTEINNPANLGGDLFAQNLNYNVLDTQLTTNTPLFDGNISKVQWKTANDNKLRVYRYNYDRLDRIVDARYESTGEGGRYDLNNVAYDKNGNISMLTRKGHTNTGATSFGTMDNLMYNYVGGNKLTKVDDTSGIGFGFKDGTNTNDDYDYDIDGNLKLDRNKGITAISYNHLNLPTQITFGNGNIQYIYAADGTKLKKIISTGAVTEYAGNYTYSGNSSGTSLQFFNHAEGYVFPETGGYSYVYQYKDHLGNVRLSYTDANKNGSIDPTNEIIQEVNYYPFGLEHKGYNFVSSPHGNSLAKQWKLGGKELDESFDLLNTYDFGARNYDPSLARWSNMDKMSEEFYGFSTYNYVLNNPISVIDPDGNFPIDVQGQIAHMYQQQSNTMMYRRMYAEYQASAGWESGQIDAPWTKNGMSYEEYQAVINHPGNYHAQMRAYNGPGKGIYNRTMDQVSAKTGTAVKAADMVDLVLMVSGAQNIIDGYNAAKAGNARKTFQHFGSAFISLTPGGRAGFSPLKTSTSRPTGQFYSVAFQTRLSKNSYPGVSRYKHFQEANIALSNAMKSNSLFSDMGITIPRSSRGTIQGYPPKEWAWHHDTTPGIMQLVPKSQHPNVPGGIFWQTMHPSYIGGYALWGRIIK